MLRKTPLRRKSTYKPVAVREHHDRVASLGCLVCGAPATIHHVSGYADRPGRITRDDWLVVPLCPPHHQIVFDPLHNAPQSVEALGHQGFYQEWGIDLYAEAMRLAEESQRSIAA